MRHWKSAFATPSVPKSETRRDDIPEPDYEIDSLSELPDIVEGKQPVA